MVGYALKIKGYRVWIPDNNNIIETLNLKYDSDNFLYCSKTVLDYDVTNSKDKSETESHKLLLNRVATEMGE